MINFFLSFQKRFGLWPKKNRFDVAANFFSNNQHVKTSLIILKVSAVCTVQQYPNVIVSWGLSREKMAHEQKDR